MCFRVLVRSATDCRRSSVLSEVKIALFKDLGAQREDMNEAKSGLRCFRLQHALSTYSLLRVYLKGAVRGSGDIEYTLAREFIVGQISLLAVQRG